LGLTGYYRRFIKGYGIICRPLHDLLKKDSFHWTEQHTIAFTTLKQKITEAPVLALPDFKLPFMLETDALGMGIGAVLMQQGKPLAYYSQALGPKSSTQSIYHKEAMAILQALRRWRHYFLGGTLIIQIDQQSLKYMMTQRVNEGIQHKLLMKLLEFNYTIKYKKGAENYVADALSRKEHILQAISSVIPCWTTDVEASYEGDKTYTDIIQQLLINDQAVLNYSVHAGILRFKGRICIGANTDLRNNILSSLHSSAIGGHSSIRATYQRVKKIFQWLNLKKFVESFVTECAVCQRAKAKHCHYLDLLSPLPIPTLAWTFISMDFIEGLPKSGTKNVILVVVDRLTKYSHFLALSHPFTTQTVAQLFIDSIFKLHGPHVAIIIDIDRIFTSRLWPGIFKSLKDSL
jgi:hypothetical protein